jgi:uncharacterized membrane protein YccF (DUF307 family)
MKKSTKAALLSGLILPGTGHLMLKQRTRGIALMAASLIALWVIVRVAWQQAMSIVDRINSGDIALDTGAISDAVSSQGAGTDGLVLNIAWLVLLACWLAGMIDSYRLGVEQDKQADNQ